MCLAEEISNEFKQSVNEDNSAIEGFILLRDHLLPDLLGKQTAALLYWAGKELGRRFPVHTPEELSRFFHSRGLGRLELEKESRKKKIYLLDGPIITARLENSDADFSLEAGLLSAQLQQLENCWCETEWSIQSKGKSIQLLAQLDPKEENHELLTH